MSRPPAATRAVFRKSVRALGNIPPTEPRCQTCAREYEKSGDMRDGVLKLLNSELQTHPFSVWRAAALTQWVDTGATPKCCPGTTHGGATTTSRSPMTSAKLLGVTKFRGMVE